MSGLFKEVPAVNYLHDVMFFATAGHFGCVYRGFMRRDDEKEEIEVAIKTLKSLSGNNPMFFSSDISKNYK